MSDPKPGDRVRITFEATVLACETASGNRGIANVRTRAGLGMNDCVWLVREDELRRVLGVVMAAQDHGMTDQELSTVTAGTTLHFTNHPCRASVPVVYIGPRGLVRLPDGTVTTEIHAFADELSRQPRAGLGA